MKTRYIKSLLALILSFVAMPLLGQDCMEVFFKDGTFRKFYLKNVTEIVTSRLDADGVLHSDYDYQHVTTINDKYIYSLEDVDCITFTKIDEEQAEENFVAAMTSIFPTIDVCETIEDVEEKIDEIKNAEGVADAWSDGHELYVAFEKGEVMSFHYDHGEIISNNTINNIKTQVKQLLPHQNSIKSDDSLLRVAIVNQQHKDEGRNGQKINYFLPLISTLRECGMKADYFPEATADFFYGNSDKPDEFLNFYDYDFIILSTHGSYSEYIQHDDHYATKVHSFQLSEDLDLIESENKDDLPASAWQDKYSIFKKWRKKLKYGDITDQQINFSFSRELRNGKYYWAVHPTLTEFFFKDVAPGVFKNGKAVFFNCACESLKDNYSFADELLSNHNLGTYVGYTESNYFGQLTSNNLLTRLLSSYSIEKAYKDLPSYMRHETFFNVNISNDFDIDDKEYFRDKGLFGAELKVLPENQLSTEELFLLPVYTDFITHSNLLNYYNENKALKLSGTLTCLSNFEDIQTGFLYGMGSLPTKTVETKSSYETFNLGMGNIVFSAELNNLEPGTYSYRAYSYDGLHFNYGNIEEFTIYDAPALSKTSISLQLGNACDIRVSAGSGDYEAVSSNPEVATPTVIKLKEGHAILLIQTLKVDKTIITVTDKQSGLTATIEVTVEPSGEVDITDGLVAYYPFNGNANDESGNGNNGTPTENVTLTTGLHGDADGAYLFGGIDKPGHIRVPNSESLRFNEEASLAFYVKPTSWVGMDGYGGRTSRGSHCFFAKPDGRGLTFHLLGDSNSFEVNSSGKQGYFINGSALVNGDYLNKWTHIAFVYTANNVYIYIDGQLITTLEGRCDFSSTNNYDMYFGKNEGKWHPYCGAMDEIRLYNRALSSEEVKELAQYAPAPDTPADLQIDTQSLEMTVGEKSSFAITSGNGSYEVINSNESVISAKLEGEVVMIEAISPGPAEITVKDNKTGQKSTVVVTVKEEDESLYITCPDNHHPHMIDLGLPSGIKWACCNVDAISPEDYGGYYAWFETEVKDEYSWSTYKHADGTMYSFHINELYEEGFAKQNDVAHVKWGGGWSLPSSNDFKELKKYCTYQWTNMNGIEGAMFTSKNNGNCIFFPAAGYKSGINRYQANSNGDYWSSGATLNSDDNWLCGYEFSFSIFGSSVVDNEPCDGNTIRPVSK